MHEEELIQRGYQRNMRLLPPKLVIYIMQEYGIVEEDSLQVNKSPLTSKHIRPDMLTHHARKANTV